VDRAPVATSPSQPRRGGLVLGALVLSAVLAAGCGGGKRDAGAPASPAGGGGGPTGEPSGGSGSTDGVPAGSSGDASSGSAAGGGGAGGSTETGSTSPDAAPRFGGPGPWPVENRSYGWADGILESPVVGVSTDEAQNLWVATNTALYLMRPDTGTFRRYSSADGLHLMDNPDQIREDYCDSTAIVNGAAYPPGISTIVGGAADEVFVGYYGADEMNGDCTDPPEARHSGKIDRVRVEADGTLDVARFDLASAGFGMQYWHNRTIRRLLYDHFIHPHTLYAGANHGVSLILPDRYRPPDPGEWPGFPILEYMGDHLHAAVCFHEACPIGSEGNQRMGDWFGLAIAPDGDLWTAGRWAAGKIRWDPLGPLHWVHRSGADAFSEAFGDPYPGNQPVFFPPLEGDPVTLSAVAVTPDDTVWFGNRIVYGPDSGERNYGIASFRSGHGFTYYWPTDVGMSEVDVQDIVALPDGRLVFAGPNTGLVFYDPATKESVPMRAGQGIPDDRVTQLELDTMVDPPALHVSTFGGAAVIRVFPR
jgi:hypothetical protein